MPRIQPTAPPITPGCRVEYQSTGGNADPLSGCIGVVLAVAGRDIHVRFLCGERWVRRGHLSWIPGAVEYRQAKRAVREAHYRAMLD